MKGIVFTEFLEMVEDKFGDEVLENTLDKSKLESGGIYTSVGTYNHMEMVELVTHLSEETGIEIKTLMEVYGNHFFSVLLNSYGGLIKTYHNAFELFKEVESHIHIEVRKIYPEAELPTFEISKEGEVLTMVYKSKRKFGDFAYGLISGCLDHFNQKARIERKDLEADGSVIEFKLIPIE